MTNWLFKFSIPAIKNVPSSNDSEIHSVLKPEPENELLSVNGKRKPWSFKIKNLTFSSFFKAFIPPLNNAKRSAKAKAKESKDANDNFVMEGDKNS